MEKSSQTGQVPKTPTVTLSATKSNNLKQNQMKTKEINVPAEIITEFADLLAEHNLTNEILGSTDDGEIIIEVQYEKEERQAVFELLELIDDNEEED
jgi:hypothetical protein